MRKLYLLLLVSLSALLSHAQTTPKAVNDVATVLRPDSVLINVLANDSNFTPTDTVCLTATYGEPAGWATISGCRRIVYRPLDRQHYGIDTFYYISCAQQSQLCDTGRVIVTVRPRATADFLTILQPDSAVILPLANDSNFVAGDTMSITTLLRPTPARAGWSVVHGRDSVYYRALNQQYYGLDTFSYRACSQRIPTLCDTGRVIVNLIFYPIALDDTAELTQPDTVLIHALANDSIFNGADSLHITSVYGVPAGWAVIQGDTAISFHPTDFHDRGYDTLYYVTCYTATPLCDTAMVVIHVTLPLPYADFLYDEFGHCQVTAYDVSELSDSVHWTVQFISGNGPDTTYGNTNVIDLAAYGDTAFQAEVCLTAYNPSGQSQTCYNFYIQCMSSGISDLTADRIRLYPNPATDALQLDLSQLDRTVYSSIDAVEIYDLAGRMLRSTPVEADMTISVRDLTTGLYLLRLTSHDGRGTVPGRFEVVR